MKIDASFIEISKDCMSMNEFVPNVKYSDQAPITKQNINKLIKSMETVCSFPPIKAMRDLFSKEHNYEIVGEITTGQDTK